MDADQIRGLKPMLTRYLKRFDDCFARQDTQAHLPVYVGGQLSDLPAKSCEPIALEAGVAPRTLQEFLSQHKWDESRMRARLQELVVSDHAGPNCAVDVVGSGMIGVSPVVSPMWAVSARRGFQQAGRSLTGRTGSSSHPGTGQNQKRTDCGCQNEVYSPQ